MSAETHSQIWDRGRADAKAEQCDEALYAQDTLEARLYRDGHRMGRREALDPIPTGGLEGQPMVAAAVEGAEHEPLLMKNRVPGTAIIEPAPMPITAAAPDHPSAFSDPIPGHKPKRAKPSDPAQASLF